MSTAPSTANAPSWADVQARHLGKKSEERDRGLKELISVISTAAVSSGEDPLLDGDVSCTPDQRAQCRDHKEHEEEVTSVYEKVNQAKVELDALEEDARRTQRDRSQNSDLVELRRRAAKLIERQLLTIPGLAVELAGVLPGAKDETFFFGLFW